MFTEFDPLGSVPLSENCGMLLRPSCALRLFSRGITFDLLLADCDPMNELFLRCSKHSKTSDDSIFCRESNTYLILTCFISSFVKNSSMDFALAEASSGMASMA